MAADKNRWRPKTLTMMGGPIDTRKAPTAINTLATQRPFAWFENNVIATVPMIYPGSGRKVYPGFLQLAGFMTMNLGSHLISHWEMFKHLVVGDEEGADATRDFYEEYRSVCDMTAEFYLQTVDVVFQRHLLPKGEMMHRGRRVDPDSDPRHRVAGDRRRARRHFGDRPDQGRARHRDQAAGSRRRNISSPRTSAITASSTAASGASGSRRSSRNSSRPTTKHLIRLENPDRPAHLRFLFQQLKGGGLMSHCPTPRAVNVVSAASAEIAA